MLLDGDPRTRPRSQTTLYAYFGSVRPFLDQWATLHDHLWEVTKSDIYAALDPLRGYQRNNAVHALRSLFRFAKKRGLISANPTMSLKARQIEPDMVPMTEDEIRAVEQIAVQPAQRVAVALAVEHAEPPSLSSRKPSRQHQRIFRRADRHSPRRRSARRTRPYLWRSGSRQLAVAMHRSSEDLPTCFAEHRHVFELVEEGAVDSHLA